MHRLWKQVSKLLLCTSVACGVSFIGGEVWAGIGLPSVPKVETPKIKVPKVSIPPVRAPKVMSGKPPQVQVSKPKTPKIAVKSPQMHVPQPNPRIMSDRRTQLQVPKPRSIGNAEVQLPKSSHISLPKPAVPIKTPDLTALRKPLPKPNLKTSLSIQRPPSTIGAVKVKPVTSTLGSHAMPRPAGTVQSPIPRITKNDIGREGRKAGGVIGMSAQAIAKGMVNGFASGRGGGEGGNSNSATDKSGFQGGATKKGEKNSSSSSSPEGEDEDKETDPADTPVEVTGSF